MTLSLTGYGRKFLSSSFPNPQVKLESTGNICHIDETDHEILRALSSNTNLSNPEYARLLGMKLSTFDYRLNILTQKGIFHGFVNGIDVTLLGYTYYKVIIHSKNVSKKFRDELQNYARPHPNINNVIACVGSWDFEIGIEVNSPHNLPTITTEIEERFSDYLVSVRVIPTFKYHKLRNYPFQNYQTLYPSAASPRKSSLDKAC
ncbi:MAG: Lrp/AsnC family transcriptional regulator, partial [Bdellovibrionales bacterium]|nr:Lrp/AsnC family transcriptional regulator [Bdellovibrionales bacterium]